MPAPFDVGAFLARVEDLAPIEAVEAMAESLAEWAQARRVTFLIADFSGRAVVRLTSVAAGDGDEGNQGHERAEVLRLPGTRYEEVLRTQRVDVRPTDAGTRLVVPVTDRGDAIGLIELDLPGDAEPTVVADVSAAAHALAYVVIAARRHTDVFEWGQRSTPFSLAAEIQRRLLPASYTCEAGQFTLAGWLEPAASAAGDTYDYTLDRHSLQLSITDAVGHEVTAAQLATVFVGALRNARRRGLDLAEQARYANDAFAANTEPGQFITGQLARIDLRTGLAVIINAGHPLPLRLRDGRVEEVVLTIDPPFGVVPGHRFGVQELPLEPGDRLLFLTDGMQERNAASLDLSESLARTAGLHPREVVHALGDAVLNTTGGNLRDDATMMCLDWYGGPPRRRESTHGADQSLASAARPGRDGSG